MSGDQFGKYEILGEIGKGGFATVFRAVDTTLDRPVALKVLDPLLARDPTWVTRFQREAKAVARLNHPHIVTIWEIGVNDGRLFIAMELVDGPSLAGRIAEHGALSYPEALGILQQVSDALDYAHAEQVIHRDLKPANILLDPKRGAILTDFGFARLVGESSMSVSVSGGVVGTPAYIAPEVWDDQEPSAASDLYALGCVAYETLTRQVLFTGKTPMAVMKKHAEGPKLPERWPAGLTTGTTAVLRRALAAQPESRHGTASEFIAALQAAQKAAQTATPPAVGTLAAPPPPKAAPDIPAAYLEPSEAAPTVSRTSVPIPATTMTPPSPAAPTSNQAQGVTGPSQKGEQPKAERVARQAGPTPVPVANPPPSTAATRPASNPRPTSSWRFVFPSARPGRNRSWILSAFLLIPFFVAFAIVVIAIIFWVADLRAKDGNSGPQAGRTVAPALTSAGEVLYTSNRDGHREVYLWRPGSGETRLTESRAGESWDPSPARNGVILFTSNREDGKREVYQRGRDGATERMTRTPGAAESWGARWAADGAVLFTSNREDSKREVYCRSGESNRRLTNSPANSESWGAVGASDGSVYFTSNRDGEPEIYMLSGDPGQIKQFTFTPRSWAPAVASDGALLFTSNRNGQAEIYRFRGNEPERLTDAGINHWSNWSQGAQSGGVWFTSDRNGKPEVFLLAHGNVTRLTNTPGSAGSWLSISDE